MERTYPHFENPDTVTTVCVCVCVCPVLPCVPVFALHALRALRARLCAGVCPVCPGGFISYILVQLIIFAFIEVCHALTTTAGKGGTTVESFFIARSMLVVRSIGRCQQYLQQIMVPTSLLPT